jgi:hypothetical protein
MIMRNIVLALAFVSASAFVQPNARSAPRVQPVSETKADLEALAAKLNPVVPFFDPIGLADQTFWATSPWEALGSTNEATIGFLRHAEIKHGRVAMAAFVGYCVQANGLRFPWPMTMDGSPFPEAGLSPEAQWDAIPFAAKWQIISVIAFLELWGEAAGDAHYMKGGKPGDFPDLVDNKNMQIPHPVPLNLFDPFGFSKKKTDAQKAEGLIKELNNGRLAQIGIMGFVAASKVDGSVPFLTGIIKHYDGDVMQPFEGNLHLFN